MFQSMYHSWFRVLGSAVILIAATACVDLDPPIRSHILSGRPAAEGGPVVPGFAESFDSKSEHLAPLAQELEGRLGLAADLFGEFDLQAQGDVRLVDPLPRGVRNAQLATYTSVGFQRVVDDFALLCASPTLKEIFLGGGAPGAGTDPDSSCPPGGGGEPTDPCDRIEDLRAIAGQQDSLENLDLDVQEITLAWDSDACDPSTPTLNVTTRFNVSTDLAGFNDTFVELDWTSLEVDYHITPEPAVEDCDGAARTIYQPSADSSAGGKTLPLLDLRTSKGSVRHDVDVSFDTACDLACGTLSLCIFCPVCCAFSGVTCAECISGKNEAQTKAEAAAKDLATLWTSTLDLLVHPIRLKTGIPQSLNVDPDDVAAAVCGNAPAGSELAAFCSLLGAGTPLADDFFRLLVERAQIDLGASQVLTGSGVTQLGAPNGVWTDRTFLALQSGFTVETVKLDLAPTIEFCSNRGDACTASVPATGCAFCEQICDHPDLAFVCQEVAATSPEVVLADVIDTAFEIPGLPNLGRLVGMSIPFSETARSIFTAPVDAGPTLVGAGARRIVAAETIDDGARFHLMDDDDGDCVEDNDDNCPQAVNTDQADTDGDGVGDACDFCAAVPDAPAPGRPQHDLDGDGIGDACDCDIDGDRCNNPGTGILEPGSSVLVECGSTSEVDGYFDEDPRALASACLRTGDCLPDDDGDGVDDATDNCICDFNPGQENRNAAVESEERCYYPNGPAGDACDTLCSGTSLPVPRLFCEVPPAALQCDVIESFLDVRLLRMGAPLTAGLFGLPPEVCLPGPDGLGCVRYGNQLIQCRRQPCPDPAANVFVLTAGVVERQSEVWRVLPAQLGLSQPFGVRVAQACDIDRDGFGDLVVPSPASEVCEATGACRSQAGQVLVLGSRDGKVLSRLQGSETMARFGESVAVADDRLFVSAPGALNLVGEPTGAVFSYRLPCASAGRQPVPLGRTFGSLPGERFGTNLAVLSVRGELSGPVGIYVAAPAADRNGLVDSGSIYGMTLDGVVIQRLDGPFAGGRLGAELAVSQSTLGASAVVAAGMPNALAGKGAVAFYDVASAQLARVVTGEVAGGHLGASVVAVDLDGDGLQEFGIGQPDAGQGRVRIVSSTFAELARSEGLPGAGLGWRLTAPGDITGDGVTDLAAAAVFAPDESVSYVVLSRTGAFQAPPCGANCEPQTCTPGVDTDRDGIDDCTETFDDDPFTNPNVFNPPAPGADCRPGVRGSHIYWLCNDKDTWFGARFRCQQGGGDLVVIGDAQENAFVTSNNARAWIGYTDIKREAQFVWVDDSVAAYTNWFPRQPDNFLFIEDCAYFGYNAQAPQQWHDLYCYGRQPGFVCEYGR